MTEASDEVLDLRNITLLSFILTHLHHVLVASQLNIHLPDTGRVRYTRHHARRYPYIVVSRVVVQFSVCHVETHNVSANVVHKILGMANEEEDFVPVAQVVLEPQDSVHVCRWKRL